MAIQKQAVRRDKADYTVLAVRNAVAILELLSNCEHELSIGEIAHRLSLTKSNTNKLLANLERFAYVEYNSGSKNFSLGVKTFQISQTYMNKLNISSTANPYLLKLNKLTGESVYVAVLRKSSVVYLDFVETDEPVRVTPRIGNISEAYATASGKIQLAYLESADIEILYQSGLSKLTNNTITDMNILFSELQKVRSLGYATDIEEYQDGVCCVASPVLDFMSNVIAAISVSAPKERLTDERIRNEIAPAVIQIAKELSIKFGYDIQSE